MSSLRLPLAALFVALAGALVPTTASAALKTTSVYATPVGYGVDQDGLPRYTADGVISPGEGIVDFNLPLLEYTPLGQDQPDPFFTGGRGDLNRVGDYDANLVNGSPGYRDYPATDGGGNTKNPTPFHVNVGSQLQCGTNIRTRLDLTTPNDSVTTSYYWGMPTGAPGAIHQTASQDVGNLIYDGQAKQSVVNVVRPGELTRGLQIHIDSILHQYSTHWLRLTLISPTGKQAVIFNQVGNLKSPDPTDPTPANKQLTNVTFSETPVNGVAPETALEAVADDFTNVVVRPADSLSVFDGEPLNGKWKLEVKDIHTALDQRSNRRGRSGGPAGKVMIQLGDWQLGTAGAVCNAKPDAWFGGADPLVLPPSPTPGATVTVNASSSVASGLDGAISNPSPTPRYIVAYKWDMDGNPNNGPNGDGFEVTTATPTSPPIPATKDTHVDIRMMVVDNDGGTSVPVTRTVVVTTKPTVDSITLTPANPKAGDPVTVTAVGGTDGAGEAGPLTYSWDLDDDGVFGDNDDATPPVSGGTSVTKIWPTSGPKVVRVKVTDGAGASTIKYETIEISNTAPHAVVTLLTTPAVVGRPVSLSGALSNDSDGTIAQYDWDLDGNGDYLDATGPTPTVEYTYDDPGLKLVRLRVTDNTGEKSSVSELAAQVEFNVTGAPVAVVTASPDSPLKGTTVTFNASGSYDSDASGSIVDYAWDLNGGNNFSSQHGPSLVSVTKSFANAGNVTIKLQVTDNSGAKTVKTLTLLVRNPDTTGGGGGGGGTPIPTTPGTGGGGGTPPPVKGLPTETTGAATDPKVIDIFNTVIDPPDAGRTPDGFSAKLAAAAKQKAKKAAKSGVLMAITTNDPGKIAIKAIVMPKDAKTVGLKIKKATAIGAGQIQITKGKGGIYTAKFYVKFKKTYAKKIKKSKKLKISMRAVVAPKSGGEKLAISRTVYIVKG